MKNKLNKILIKKKKNKFSTIFEFEGISIILLTFFWLIFATLTKHKTTFSFLIFLTFSLILIYFFKIIMKFLIFGFKISKYFLFCDIISLFLFMFVLKNFFSKTQDFLNSEYIKFISKIEKITLFYFGIFILIFIIINLFLFLYKIVYLDYLRFNFYINFTKKQKKFFCIKITLLIFFILIFIVFIYLCFYFHFNFVFLILNYFFK